MSNNAALGLATDFVYARDVEKEVDPIIRLSYAHLKWDSGVLLLFLGQCLQTPSIASTLMNT